MANDKFTVVGTNIAEKATMIWNVADMLRGPFKPHEYGLVILPMTVVKRFHDCLLPTHQVVLDTWEKVKKFAVVDGFLTKASGYQFYNTSKFTFDSLLADPENIEANFKDYLNGFSTNVQDVLSKFDFDNIIKRMVESNTLYLVIKEYNSPKGYQFQYIISNPPFGIDWKREQKVVEAEAKKGELGRFAPGLPKISDGQQLFVLNGLSKLATNGKMAIIQNGSPLFSGDAGSGPSEIRRYILENDWLDAIIQMSTDMFMNTGISTYIWVLNKNKPAWRAGKVQLIDASHCAEPRRKSIGTKRNDITDLCRDLIIEAYGDFKEAVYGDKNGIYCESKIFESTEFGYNKIVVERPQKDEDGNVIKKKGKPVADASQRDTENVPLTENINTYFEREVLPYAPDAWIDTKKTKVGYEIPMTRYFYEYQAPEPVEEIATRLHELELDIQSSLDALFGGE